MRIQHTALLIRTTTQPHNISTPIGFFKYLHCRNKANVKTQHILHAFRCYQRPGERKRGRERASWNLMLTLPSKVSPLHKVKGCNVEEQKKHSHEPTYLWGRVPEPPRVVTKLRVPMFLYDGGGHFILSRTLSFSLRNPSPSLRNRSFSLRNGSFSLRESWLFLKESRLFLKTIQAFLKKS